MTASPSAFVQNQNRVPLSGKLANPDRLLREGIHKGKACWYKTGLLNTLVALKPEVCLEIGTHMGGSAQIFEFYFQRFMPQGLLITADIKKYTDLSGLAHVRPVLVYPHIYNIDKDHHVLETEMLPGAKDKVNDSVAENCKILSEALQQAGREHFDFAFVDGDHTELSFLRDLEIAQSLNSPPRYTLIDDTKEGLHECMRVYQEKICPHYNHYDFEDWPIFVGTGLIWDKSETK